MNTKRILIGLIGALVISTIITVQVGKRLSASKTNSGTLPYLALKVDGEAGSILKAEDVQTVKWPKNAAISGAFTNANELAGRSLLYPVAAGEPLLKAQLSEPGAGFGLSGKIPDGMRALSLRSDQVVGVAGYLFPGTHVDVLVTYRVASSPNPVTTIVLQDAMILTAGQKMQADPQGKPAPVDVVTLLVSPEDAERVVLATSQGSVHFVLRGSDDHSKGTVKAMQITSLGAVEPPLSVPRPTHQQISKPVQAKYTIEVQRGDKQTVESFK